jgi:hypothetical protein
MSSNLKALHTYFYLLQENPKKKTKKRKKRERERKIIELIIKENHCCDLGTERKMRRTLPLGNLKKKRKKKKTNVSVRDTDFANSNIANRKNTDFSSRLLDGILGKPNQKGKSPLKIDQSEYMWAGRP